MESYKHHVQKTNWTRFTALYLLSQWHFDGGTCIWWFKSKVQYDCGSLFVYVLTLLLYLSFVGTPAPSHSRVSVNEMKSGDSKYMNFSLCTKQCKLRLFNIRRMFNWTCHDKIFVNSKYHNFSELKVPLY